MKKETKHSEERYIAAFAPDGRKEAPEPRKKKPRVFLPDPYPAMIGGSCAASRANPTIFVGLPKFYLEPARTGRYVGTEDVPQQVTS